MPFFDLANIKIRAPINGFSVPAEPTKLFDHDPTRLVAIFYTDYNAAGYLIAARSPGKLYPIGSINNGIYFPLEIYGPEEIWVVGSAGGVFEPVNGYYQAIYRD